MHRQSSAPGADAGGGPASPALAEELRKLVLEQMAKRLERMFEGADNLLLSMADRARGAEEQRRNFDTRHLVKKHRADLTRVFLDELGAAFKPGADAKKKPENSDIDFEELHLWKTRTIDESIAVNNIAVKAENSNEQPLREIDRRLDWLIHERGAPISPAALKPATL